VGRPDDTLTATPRRRVLSAHARRTAGLLAGALTVVFALVGCSAPGGEDARTVIQNVKPLRSADVSLELRVALDRPPPEVGGPLVLTAKGPLRAEDPKRLPQLDWNIAFSGFGERFASRLVSTGDDAFVRLGGVDFEVGRAQVAQLNAQAARSAQQNPQGLASLGIDPLDSVKSAEEAGKGSVAGTETTRYEGNLDLGKVLVDANRLLSRTPPQSFGGQPVPKVELTPEKRKQITDAYDDPRFELDIAEDDTIRRLSFETRFRTTPEQRAAAGGVPGGTIAYRVEYGNVNGAQRVSPPRGARPLAEFQRELNKLLSQQGR
jgi:hypothetical protein